MSEHKRLVDNIKTRMAVYVNDLRILKLRQPAAIVRGPVMSWETSLPEDHPHRVNFPQWADQLEQEANAPKPKKRSWLARLFGKT